MRRTRSLCCARAASGHKTAALPPSSVMKSRRLISNWQWSVSGHSGILQPLLVLPTREGDRPLHIRYDERADRAAFAAAPEAYMAMGVLTRLHLLTLEQVAGRDIKPARTRLHQLIAGDREAIHVAAAC